MGCYEMTDDELESAGLRLNFQRPNDQKNINVTISIEEIFADS